MHEEAYLFRLIAEFLRQIQQGHEQLVLEHGSRGAFFGFGEGFVGRSAFAGFVDRHPGRFQIHGFGHFGGADCGFDGLGSGDDGVEVILDSVVRGFAEYRQAFRQTGLNFRRSLSKMRLDEIRHLGDFPAQSFAEVILGQLAGLARACLTEVIGEGAIERC